jgi:O-antigen/teichoic acid export membrane protein
MNGIRSALAVTTAERYCGMAINFVLIAVISRVLTPGEIGIWAVATALVTLLYSAREFATMNYLVARKDLTAEDVRTAFTVNFLLTLFLCILLALGAGWVAAFYDEAGLRPYLLLVSFALLIEVVAAPITALMRRELAFGKVAIINVGSGATMTGATIALASLGHGYMSFAWGLLIGAATGSTLALVLRGELWIFRPLLTQWRGMLRFGSYHGANVALFRLFDSLPLLMMGRMISTEAAGLFNRTIMTCQLPDKVFLSGVISVALPAFSVQVREKRNLKQAYLQALEHMTAVQWPALVVLAILAHPIVLVLFGEQWLSIVPLVQIVAIGWMFSFSFELNYPLLQALDALRDTLVRALIVWPVSALVIIVALSFGMTAVAFSFWVTIPFQAVVALYLVRRHIRFEWMDVARAVRKSALVTFASMLGPATTAILSPRGFELQIWEALIAVILSGAGWLCGLFLTRHPLLGELRRAGGVARAGIFRAGGRQQPVQSGAAALGEEPRNPVLQAAGPLRGDP